MLKYLELAVCGTNLKPTYPFIGSTIRGTFGHALRYASCPYISQECDTCDISGSCVYDEFFENISNTPNFRLDIEILEPKSLRDKFKEDLKIALDLLNK